MQGKLIYSKRFNRLIYVCDTFIEQCKREYDLLSVGRKAYFRIPTLNDYILSQAEQQR